MDLSKATTRFLYILALFGGLIHLINALTGTVTAYQMRPLHLGLAGVLVFMTGLLSKKVETKHRSAFGKVKLNFQRVIDVVTMLFIVLSCGYFGIFHSEIARRAGYITTENVVFGSMLVIAVLYLAWRRVGVVLPIVAASFVVYALFGNMLPGALGHRGYSFSRVANFLYTNGNGIFGVPIDTASRYLVIFLVFGNFIERSGTSHLFYLFAQKIARNTRGGAAKSAVVASALFGTMSGNPVANVMVTGSFTIPMMKKTGFEPNFAAGVEATASTGGLIMPPIMGAGAFMMAELLGIGYQKVMLAAALPAILYYFSIYVAVDFYSAKKGINRVTDPPDPNEEKIRDYIHTIIPITGLRYNSGQ